MSRKNKLMPVMSAKPALLCLRRSGQFAAKRAQIEKYIIGILM